MAKKFYIRTFGCQMNKNDSSIITKILEDRGYTRTEEIPLADILLVNTCSVREHAENRALGYISTLKRWRNEKKRVLGVVGCMAKRLAGRITAQLPFVDLVIGPDSYRNLPDYIEDVIESCTRIIETSDSDETYCGIYPRSPAVCDFVSIMRGCNNYCSYCIVPYVRGRVRSRPPDDIISEIKHLIAKGVKDITLLGQNVNAYYFDGATFAVLLQKAAQIPGLTRLRFLTSHPKDFNDEMIDTVKKYENICEWFHLPLQSGCNRILELMNRGYTKEEFVELVTKIRHCIPEATITTDVIVGFPTETEEEFMETLALLDELKFDDAYMYRYSPRPGTRACRLTPLPEDIIKSRLKKLIEFQNKIMLDKIKAMVGHTYEVLFEAKSEYGGTRGKTRGNRDVVVEETIEPGEIRKVLICEVRGRTPIGKTA
ncbi:MAG TPA: tRNA (N6-isopentenyl adenosine(37)-C2)-methylthiotransferase MiaB [candidate division WOR-3 bacterium]|uniref:tRNA-2-methylthio-N(6)-dimethylallyladenosine synthase n=1 Tax=candidate division WOR-3 bacterium TaxID=2052148 RepID=A0A9C9K0X2_UNCW3|nr:tRNA (N6-isopentenyl adenosine(37)-C2)-methylthiotransferase MiaB [candidate division WOR-3 bacterium]